MTLDLSRKYNVGPDVHVRGFDCDLVLLNLRSGEYFALDAVGAEIWKGLSEGNSPDAVVKGICARYAVDAQRATDDVSELVRKLLSEGLLVVDEPRG
jgi:hypothetical protein